MRADVKGLAVGRGGLSDYVPLVGEEAVERLLAAAAPLRGERILHVTVAGAASRAPELLSATLPLAAEAGLDVRWYALFGDAELHELARELHDGLQGAETALDDARVAAYREACAAAGSRLSSGYDVVVLHDPATLGLAPELGERPVWRCHVDASRPDRPALERAMPLIKVCRALLFPMARFAPAELEGARLYPVPPGIDPLAARNRELPPGVPGRIVSPLGIDLERPFALHAMRLDRWKDPHRTIEAFDAMREGAPQLQLVLAGRLEGGDPAGWQAAKEVADYAAGRADVHVLTSYEGIGDMELGALQRLARVALQLSLREGFGLGASEALWKGTPVVGGRDGGLPLQVREGVEGFLCDTTEEVAARVVELISDPGLTVEMGRTGREHVRERFLAIRAMEDELRALAAVLESPPAPPGGEGAGATVNAP